MAITRLGPNQDITAAKIAGQINFKNLIINGDMSIAQRGTQSTGQTNTDGYSTCDRFRVTNYIGTSTFDQETLTSGNAYNNGFRKAFKITITSAEATPSAGDQLYFETRLEGQMLQQLKKGTANAESLTLSFWVKSSKTGTNLQVNFRDIDNSRMISGTYDINSADTWEKKTITVAGDTTGAFDNDNGGSLRIEWYLDSGSSSTGGTLQTSWATRNVADSNITNFDLGGATDNWAITGIQLEADTSASDFEFLPRDINIQRCARYFVKIDTNNAGNNNTFVDSLYGVAGTDSVAFLPYENIVPFRTAPSLSQSAVISLDEYFVAVRTQSSTSIASNNPQSRHGANIKLSNFSSMTRGNGVQLNSGGTINMDAEL